MMRTTSAALAPALALAGHDADAQAAPEVLQAPRATAAGTTELTVRPGLEMFAHHALRLTNTDAEDTDVTHEFDLPRAHASLSADYRTARARVVFEGVRSASEGALLGVAGDSLIMRVREAWGGWTSPRVDVRAGVVPTLTVPRAGLFGGGREMRRSCHAMSRGSPGALGVAGGASATALRVWRQERRRGRSPHR